MNGLYWCGTGSCDGLREPTAKARFAAIIDRFYCFGCRAELLLARLIARSAGQTSLSWLALSSAACLVDRVSGGNAVKGYRNGLL